MSVKELMTKIGKSGVVKVGGLSVEVTIVDIKTEFGRERYLVTPVKGSGEVWIESVAIAK